MKVALVAEKLDLQRGGAERSIYELGCHLAEAGLEVTLVACHLEGQALKTAPFALHVISGRGAGRVAQWRNYVRDVGDYLASADYDIVHSVIPLPVADVYQPRGGSIAGNMDRNCRSYEKPAAVMMKRWTAFLNRARAARIAAERSLCRNPRGPVIAALSRYVKDQFQELYDMPERRLAIVRGGIDMSRFEECENTARRAVLRRKLDCDENKCLFLFVAENSRLKGFPWLSRSVALLDKSVAASCSLVYLSRREPDSASGATEALQSLDSCHVACASAEEMPDWYAAADVVVLPTWHDACSRVVLEGLAAGKPVITTRFNGACDFLDEGKFGIILDECGDDKALAAATAEMADPQRRRSYVDAIRQADLHERLSMKRHVRELVALYKKLVQKSRYENHGQTSLSVPPVS